MVKEKLGAGISLLFSEGVNAVVMFNVPVQNDESLPHHPSEFHSQGEIKNAYPVADRTPDRGLRGRDSATAPERWTSLEIAPL